MQHAQLALSMNPREANELLARAYTELRQYAQAEQCARNAIEAGDHQPTSILLLAEVQRLEFLFERTRAQEPIAVFKNALTPVITVGGPMVAGLLTGSFFVESMFRITGVGALSVSSFEATRE